MREATEKDFSEFKDWMETHHRPFIKQHKTYLNSLVKMSNLNAVGQIKHKRQKDGKTFPIEAGRTISQHLYEMTLADFENNWEVIEENLTIYNKAIAEIRGRTSHSGSSGVVLNHYKKFLKQQEGEE